jgi:hypothetical protein
VVDRIELIQTSSESKDGGSSSVPTSRYSPATTFLLACSIIYNCTDVVELDYRYCICFRKSLPPPVNMPPIYLTSP